MTNGLADPGGQYVGSMTGDVNNSAVLLDVDAWDGHIIVASGALNEYLGRAKVSDMWCSKISQAALLGNHRVVHLIFNGCDLDRLGPVFESLSAKVDLGAGDVNMFEMFGTVQDELAVFAAQIEKLKLMFEQLYEQTDGAIGSIIRSELEDAATSFYVDQGMWRPNAAAHRDQLRVVGIPHDQVPRLQLFVSYLNTAKKALLHSEVNDPDQLRALNVLTGIASSMLTTNGDLFNKVTSEAVDGARESLRVVYDFSKLMRRGRGVATAQLVNVIGFAVGGLDAGDVVVLHGAERIDERVKPYLSQQFGQLCDRGGRLVYSYDSVDAMLDDAGFNTFDGADYTILGTMLESTVERYQELMRQKIPPDLARLVTLRDDGLAYLRRSVTNVVFEMDLALGINPAREEQRRRIHELAARQMPAAEEEVTI